MTAPGALAALGAVGRAAVADANYVAVAADRTIAFTSLTAARIVTVPAASSYPTGTQLVVVDESGSCSATNTITLSRAGSDTINGAASATIALTYGYLALVSNGVGKWTLVDQATASLAQQAASSVAITGGTIDGTTIGATTPPAAAFTQIGFGSLTGTIGAPNKISLYGVTYTNTSIGLGVSQSGGVYSIDYNIGSAGYHSFYYGGVLRHRLSASAGGTYFQSLDNTPIGATTPSTVKATSVTATASVNLPSYTVATLPAPGTAGRIVYCANARMMTTGGAVEASGAGTGGLVSDNGTAWTLAGTNITASA